MINEIKSEGVKIIVVYANSICSYVNMDKLCDESDMMVITPFYAYEKLDQRYQKPCAWATTITALVGIENSLIASNSNIEVSGFYNLSIATAIDNGLDPTQVIRQNELKELIDSSTKAGCDCIILGCTHLPYLMSELLPLTSIPIIDPPNIMLDILKTMVTK